MGKSLAPLLDVILIVLTMFMITAAVAIERMGERERLGPPLRLPKTLTDLPSTGGLSNRKSLTLSVKPSGKGEGATYFIGDRRVVAEKLESALRARRPPEVLLRVDGRVPHRYTARILQLAEKMGFAISFVTTP